MFIGSWGKAFQEKEKETVVYEVVSRKIVNSTTAQNQCFLDVKAFVGLDFLLLEVHQYLTENLHSADLIVAVCLSKLPSAALLKQVKFL